MAVSAARANARVVAPTTATRRTERGVVIRAGMMRGRGRRGGARCEASATTGEMEEERSASDKVSNGATTAVQENGERQEVGRAARYMRELIKNQVNSNHLARAGSITDSSVLRRKGRLKEQDALIEFIVELHKTHTTEEVFQKVEGWIDEVLELPKEKRRFSKLSRMVPAVGFFFHRLDRKSVV